jgi:uncharacterized coiled-coil DUF342 family protein
MSTDDKVKKLAKKITTKLNYADEKKEKKIHTKTEINNIEKLKKLTKSIRNEVGDYVESKTAV